MPNEILNILELEEKLKSEKPSRFFKNRSNIVKICSIIAYELSCVASGPNIPYTIVVNLLIPLLIKDLYRNWRKLDDIQGIIVKEIRETSDYQKCINLYNEYIRRLAELISKFNFTNAKETIFYFDILLTHGFLSSNFKNIYHNFKNDKNFIVEIFGARTLSGASVCRHMSCLAADCFNELGYKSEMINVKKVEDVKSITSPRDLNKLKWNHGVVGIAERNSKILYDPTNSRLSGKVEVENQELKDYYAGVTFTNQKGYLLINPEQYCYSKKHNNLQELMQLPLEKLDEGELFAIREKMFDFFEINQGLAYKFALENLNLTKEIAELESAICPHNDKEITSWSLKKRK